MSDRFMHVTDQMSAAHFSSDIISFIISLNLCEGNGGVWVQVDNSVEMIAFHLDQPIAAHKPEFVAGTSHSSVEQGFSGELQGSH